MKIELDGYQALNLRIFLEWAGFFANSGDWYGEVLRKLPTLKELDPDGHFMGESYSSRLMACITDSVVTVPGE